MPKLRRPDPQLRHPDPPLRDEVVLLRPWHARDLPRNLMQFADPSVLRFSWTRTTPYTEDDARWFFDYQERSRLRGEELSFAFARAHDDDDVLGGGSIYDIEREHARAAVGYWLRPTARGSGVATHATRLMARFAFDVLGTQRLELTCGPENTASQRVAERCGFHREGVLRSHMDFQGGRRDTIMFSLLAGELR